MTSTLPESERPPASGDEAAPLTFGQQRLWLLWQMGRQLTEYNVPQALLLEGALDRRALASAIDAVVRRQAALRTALTEVDGEPAQRVVPARATEFAELDCSGTPDPLRAALDWAAGLGEQPFDFGEGHLLRCGLATLGPQRSLLSVTLSHFVCDGWSLGVLWREIDHYYGGGDGPAPLPRSLVEHARWQRQRFRERRPALVRYWREALSGAPTLVLPTDGERTFRSPRRGALLRFEVGADTLCAARALGAECGATLYMVLLAAVKTVLARHSGQSDVVIGSPIAHRAEPAVKPLIGMVANMMVLRTDLGGEPSFRDVVQRVREVVIGAVQHSEMPFEQLVAELRPPRDRTRNPLFDVVMVLDDEAAPPRLGDLCARELQPPHTTAKFDLTLAMVPAGDGLRAVLEYDTDLFAPARIERLVGHLQLLLRAGVDNPQQCVWRLPMLTERELGRVLPGAARLARGAAPTPVLERIAAQVAARPDATAIVDPDGTHLAFGALWQRAGALAAQLRALDGDGDAIGVLLPRGIDLVVSLLAAWRAGRAYVPLDPLHPAPRLAAMIDDARIGCVVADAVDPALEPHLRERGVVHVAPRAPSPADAPRPNGAAETAGALAYVLFTSGSTGRPKGVEVTHSGLAHLVDWHLRRYPVGPGERAVSVAGAGFDAFGWELWPPLAAGAAVWLADDAVRADPARLWAWLRDNAVHWAFAPTGLAEAMLLQSGPPPRHLRALLTGGERLTRRPPPALGFTVHNHYGPTEGTVVSTAARVDPGPAAAGSPPIGTPIDGTLALVVDRWQQPVPVGVSGELWIGGAGVARGYRGDPQRTAAHFVEHPLLPGVPMYRTGDQVRWREDGQLDFVGRLDHQIKIRGLRVELGEIEHALRRQPAVGEAVCVVQGGEQAPRLVAYVCARPGHPLDVEQLRAALLDALPIAMVPAAIVLRTGLPRTATGKVDRTALASDDARLERGAADREPPRAGVEQRLAALWCDELDLSRVARDDNLFEIGGHSLHAIRLRRRIEREFGVAVPVALLFEHSSIATMAAHLAGQDPAAPPAPTAAADRSAAPASDSDGEADAAIAIIGIGGRFPQAKTLDEFWDNLCAGREAVRWFDDAELRAAGGVPDALLSDPQYVPARAILEDIDQFDAGLFRTRPREAEQLDPQVRLFLEIAWQTTEDAGYDPRRVPGECGVYAGCGINSYERHCLAHNPDYRARTRGFEQSLADQQFLTLHVSHKLGLRGPSLQIDTASSTSLVAVVQACQALLAGHCDLALAGGVNLSVPQQVGHLFREGDINSPDGHCRPFDAAAAGTVGGEGAGAVLLKPLRAALRDGDPVRAVIRGAAINNDGSAKVSFTAPSVQGQVDVIRKAQRKAGIDPATIDYVECHGTATALGDSVEIAALRQAFAAGGERAARCTIGSLKSNLGHLDAAAGIAGLLKTVLSLERGALPPTLHFETANPELHLDESPFEVNTSLRAWPRHPHPRRAAVSSFGVGGTNAHVVLEQAAPPPAVESAAPDAADAASLLVLSARSEAALARMRTALATHLEAGGGGPLRDVAWTLQTGRPAFRHRHAVLADDRAGAVAALRGERGFSGTRSDASPPVAFLLPGQGSQHAGMGAALYRHCAAFRRAFDECADGFAPLLELDLRSLLWGDEHAAQRARLDETRFAQPAVFAVDYALARTWLELGVRPAALLGHSLGDWVAATLLSVFRLEDALRLVALRGALVQRLPAGAMLHVEHADDPVALRGLGVPVGDGPAELAVAAVNTEDSCVLAGTVAAVAGAEAALAARRIGCRRLATSHAFHSAMMEPALDELAAAVAATERQPPDSECAVYSAVRGGRIAAEALADVDYWVDNLRQPVRFAAALAALRRETAAVLLEVGPGQALTAAGRAGGDGAIAIPTAPHPARAAHELRAWRGAAGQLFIRGVDLRWEALHDGERRRCSLPGTVFARERYWIEPHAPHAPAPRQAATASEDRLPREQWLSAATWQRAGRVPTATDTGGKFAVLTGTPASRALADRLAAGGAAVRRHDAGSLDDATLRALLADSGIDAVLVAHELAADAPATPPLWQLLERCHQLRTAGDRDFPAVVAVTDGLLPVAGEAIRQRHRAAALAACQTRRQSGWIDLPARFAAEDCDAVAALVRRARGGTVTAIRDGLLWQPTHRGLRPGSARPLRCDGTHWITGGTGGVGTALATALADAGAERLVLIARQPASAAALARLAPLRARVDVRIVRADVTDAAALRALLAETGPVRGVVHAACPRPDNDNEATIAAVLAAKIDATEHLTRLLVAQPLQYFCVCSSLASVLPTASESRVRAAYAAANAFLDAWAQDRHPWPTVAIGWETWREAGMARAALGDEAADAHPELALGLSDADGRWVLGAALGMDEPLVRVSTTALEDRLRDVAPAPNSPAPRPTAGSQTAGPESIEAALRAALLPLLGVDRIEAEDDLFELGFDSLVGHRWIARLRQAGIELPLRAALETPRLTALAEVARPIEASTDAREHPLLGATLECGASRGRWQSTLSPSRDWVLGEHRVGGRAVLVGSAYLELARAAFAAFRASERDADGPVEIRDLTLLRPITAADGGSATLHTSVRRDAESAAFEVSAGEHGPPFATARLRPHRDADPAPLDLAGLRRDGRRLEPAAAPTASGAAFGPRWRCLRQIWHCAEGMLAELQLPAAHAEADAAFALHPAVLDAGVCIDGAPTAQLVPFAYERATVYGPVTAHCFAWTRVRARAERQCVVDADWVTPAGETCLSVRGLVLRRASPRDNARLHIATPGLLETLTLVPAPRRPPAAGEIEIAVAFAALNFKDVLLALGKISHDGNAEPPLGFECAGTVVRVGTGVDGPHVGDSVVALAPGAAAHYVTCAANAVARCPDGLDLAAAATLPGAYLTAHHALVTLAELREGQRVLIHAATGGVGSAAVHVARVRGAEVLATAGSPAKRALLRDRGVRHVADSRSDAFATMVGAATDGRGADIVLNSTTGALAATSVGAVAANGHFVELGVALPEAAHRRGDIQVHRVVTGPGTPSFDTDWQAVGAGLTGGVLPPLRATVFAAERAALAFELMARGEHVGKVLLHFRGDG